MAKKKQRAHQVSKGEGSNVSRDIIKKVRRSTTGADRALNKLKAWRAGKNPWITIPGPSSNKAFIKVKANKYWGDPRRNPMHNIKPKDDEE